MPLERAAPSAPSTMVLEPITMPTVCGRSCTSEPIVTSSQPVGWRGVAATMRQEAFPPAHRAPVGGLPPQSEPELPIAEGFVCLPRQPTARADQAAAAREAVSSSTSAPFGIGRDAVLLAHRKKRRAPREFDDPKEKEAFLVDEQIRALVPLLPLVVVTEMLGGARGLEQVPDEERRRSILEAVLGSAPALKATASPTCARSWEKHGRTRRT